MGLKTDALFLYVVGLYLHTHTFVVFSQMPCYSTVKCILELPEKFENNSKTQAAPRPIKSQSLGGSQTLAVFKVLCDHGEQPGLSLGCSFFLFLALLLDTMYKHKTAGILLDLRKQQGRKSFQKLF